GIQQRLSSCISKFFSHYGGPPEESGEPGSMGKMGKAPVTVKSRPAHGWGSRLRILRGLQPSRAYLLQFNCEKDSFVTAVFGELRLVAGSIATFGRRTSA